MSEEKFQKLVDIMARLRGFPAPGCPWDMKQTHRSILPYIVEETYEVVDAIEQEKPEKISEELGDLLLQVVFHSQMAKEAGDFDIDEVLDKIAAKLIRRHPHVFGDKDLKTPQEVLVEWEKIKLEQEPEKRESILDGLPKHLPALLTAQRIQERAGRRGFDWKDHTGPLEKLREELAEFEKAVEARDRENIEEELGDILFSLVNIARFMEINAEEALRGTNKKFITRFRKIEKAGSNLTLDQMEEIWQKSKEEEKR